MSKKKDTQATAQDVVRWMENADRFQLMWAGKLCTALHDRIIATDTLLDTEAEPF